MGNLMNYLGPISPPLFHKNFVMARFSQSHANEVPFVSLVHTVG